MNTLPYYVVAREIIQSDLSSNSKLLYSVISVLITEDGCCVATNKYLAGVLNVSIRVIQNALKELESKEYILSYIENNNKREIYLNLEKLTEEQVSRYKEMIKKKNLKKL